MTDLLPCVVLCASVVLCQSLRTQEDVLAGLPRELRTLAEKVMDGTRLGGAVATALVAKPDKKESTAATAEPRARAIELLAKELGTWTAVPENALQRCDGKGESAQWYCVTLMLCDLDSIERGENAQGRVSNDSGWPQAPSPSAGGSTASAVRQRTFTLTVKDGKYETPVLMRQTRVDKGPHTLQRSVSQWDYSGYLGRGTDWLVPVVGADGRIRGHLLVSKYMSTYGDAGAAQRKAVLQWRELAEAPQQAQKGATQPK